MEPSRWTGTDVAPPPNPPEWKLTLTSVFGLTTWSFSSGNVATDEDCP